MLTIFRTNQLFASILLLFYAFVVRLSSFFSNEAIAVKGEGVWSNWVYSYVGTAGWPADITALLLIFLQGVLLSVIVVQYRMATTTSLFPGVFYILVMSSFPDFMYLSPVLLGNTFLILALFEIMETYKKPSSAGNNYNIGLWISAASLFYPSFLLFFFLGWAGLSIMRAFRPKERLMLISGFLTPYLLVFAYHFWYDSLAHFGQKQFVEGFQFINFISDGTWLIYIKGLLFIGLVLVSILSYRTYTYRKNIRVQKNITVLYLALLISLPSLLFQAHITIVHLLILAAPLGVFLSFNFSEMRHSTAEAIHFVWLVGILCWQFFPIFGISLDF